MSIVFGCIPNDLMIAKLAVHGFDNNSPKLIHNYLSNTKQIIVLTAYGKIFFMVFRKFPYLNPCFSIYTYVKQKLQKQAYPSSSRYLPV